MTRGMCIGLTNHWLRGKSKVGRERVTSSSRLHENSCERLPGSTSVEAPLANGHVSASHLQTGSPSSWFSNLVKCSYNWNDWKKVLDVQPTLFYVHADEDFQAYSGVSLRAIGRSLRRVLTACLTAL